MEKAGIAAEIFPKRRELFLKGGKGHEELKIQLQLFTGK